MLLNQKKILCILAERQMTQTELAAKTQISRQSVNTILRRGTCNPVSAGRLVAGLGVSVEEITRDY